jgi:hypothetical protein
MGFSRGYTPHKGFNRGVSIDREKLVLPKDEESKKLVESYLDELNEDVSHMVAASFISVVADRTMDADLAVRLANEGRLAPDVRTQYGGILDLTHGRMANVAMQRFSRDADEAIRSEAREWAEGEGSFGYLDKDRAIGLLDERDRNIECIAKFVNGQRQIVQQQYYDIAEKWAAKPNLSKHDACHGAMWEVQKNFGDNFGMYGDMHTRVQPQEEYAALYDKNQAPNIEAGVAMRAADLFT